MKQTTCWKGTLARALLGLAALASLGMLYAANEAAPPPQSTPKNAYIGSDRCKSCHSSVESGDQHAAWLTTNHAKAYDVLASDEAKRIAAERGIADPQKSDDCLRCHVTAFGEPEAMIKRTFKREQGVQCESCHGPGDLHMRARFAAAAKGDLPEGYIDVPDDEIVKVPKQTTCLGCHNDASPTFERFCYYEFKEKNRHLNPLKPREEGSMLVCGCDPCDCVTGCPDDGCAVPEGSR